MRGETNDLSLKGKLGRDVWTVPAMLEARATRSPGAPALWTFDPQKGVWLQETWGEYRKNAARIARGFARLGLSRGERVGIMANTSACWDLLHMGILAAGGVVVGLDTQDLDENLNSVAERCQLAGLIVQDPTWLQRFGSHIRDALRIVVCLRNGERSDQEIEFDELLKVGEPPGLDAWHCAEPDAPATVIFTSGTTGSPKGIEYSHRQLCLAVASILNRFPTIDQQSRLACWLPLSNMFQRVTNMVAIGCGAQTYFVEDPRAIMAHVALIKPHLFIGVPRFYEKLYTGILEKARSGPRWQRSLIDWALRIGDGFAGLLRGDKSPTALQRASYFVADRLVLRRLRSAMGPDLRFLVSGSAPMPIWLLECLHAMGFLVLEAYALSENAIPIAANRPKAYRFGTVGQVMLGCDIRLAADGELLVRGPGVASAYYREPQSTLVDANGYLATGDYAVVDPEGFVNLTGRKSDIFKTATGRRIAPAAIESLLMRAPSVEHAVVFGASRPFLVAIIVFSPVAIEMQRGANGQKADLLAYCQRVRREIALSLKPLPAYKRPGGLLLTTRQFSVAGGELTNNFKLRRRNVAERYANELNVLYRLLDRAKGEPFMEELVGRKSEIILCST